MNSTSNATRPLLISFSGIDGAGKSTQIALLQIALQAACLRYKVITFWDDVVALKSFREQASHTVFKGDKGVGSEFRPIQRRDKNVKSPILTVVRMLFYLLDTLSLRLCVRRIRSAPPGTGVDVVIFDRYIYDELANLSESNPLCRFYTSILLRLIPAPDVAFVLDADPDGAFARKPEYPLAFLHANRKAYLDLAKLARMTVIAPFTIQEAHSEIMQHVWNKRSALRAREKAAGHHADQQRLAS